MAGKKGRNRIKRKQTVVQPIPDRHLICVTGLPRAGSTLLCRLLGMHPEIYSPACSSPLCQTLTQLRHNLSDNDFLLSQLDLEFDLVYQRLFNAFRGFAGSGVGSLNIRVNEYAALKEMIRNDYSGRIADILKVTLE